MRKSSPQSCKYLTIFDRGRGMSDTANSNHKLLRGLTNEQEFAKNNLGGFFRSEYAKLFSIDQFWRWLQMEKERFQFKFFFVLLLNKAVRRIHYEVLCWKNLSAHFSSKNWASVAKYQKAVHSSTKLCRAWKCRVTQIIELVYLPIYTPSALVLCLLGTVLHLICHSWCSRNIRGLHYRDGYLWALDSRA